MTFGYSASVHSDRKRRDHNAAIMVFEWYIGYGSYKKNGVSRLKKFSFCFKNLMHISIILNAVTTRIELVEVVHSSYEIR